MFESAPSQGPSSASGTDQDRASLPARARRIDSERLLAGDRELVIDHGGQEYRLRRTRNDKLILTK